ncbi:aminoglycoside phosphotransferase [Roseivivax halodurans JCM 10272]|uniref:Aminoglycoside phosphotransferase n=1 Tax=Roseivivax halodurans JCM 10272 TaxID=1449350 RepID=X7ECS4_9RHOB|nr:phosphotransferase [Roseivivax halodurans]ETX12888.1 aminoglycoside phosphotransferase [Roseivivax halodurans JCM 10272]
MRDFLTRAGWGEAEAAPLAGDASTRRYTRLHREDDSAILMEDPGGDVALFARLADYLRGAGLSAPEILAMDPGRGLMLLEDFGDALFARRAECHPDEEPGLYQVAADVLLTLHRTAPADGLATATPAYLASLTGLAFDWYLPRAGGTPDASAEAAARDAFAEALEAHAPEAGVTVLRDYHAENLVWLPDRDGPRRAGLLDFQDAWIGHPAYDLVSLLQDARRDVGDAAAAACLRHYLDGSGLEAQRLETACAVLGAQRNLRILGVFARLAVTRANPRYIDLVPRVWHHLQSDLAHPALAKLRGILDVLPAPTPSVLERLRTP